MIFLHRKNKLVYNIIFFFLIVVFIIGSGYYLSYLKYNDYDLTEVEALKAQNKLLQDELKEYEVFKSRKGTYVIGRIIVRDIYNFYKEVVVDLGAKDNIKIGDAVINSEGLVGVVYKVEENKSYIKLLTSNYNISVKINETYGNINGGKITLLDKYNEINVGDKVYTSSYSGLNEGIYIGEIESIHLDNEKLGQVAKVKLIDNKHLNYVAILTEEK